MVCTSALDATLLILKPGVLEAGVYYKARVYVDVPGEESSYVDHDFYTNLPPKGGTCSIDPKEGTYTNFNSCTIVVMHSCFSRLSLS